MLAAALLKISLYWLKYEAIPIRFGDDTLRERELHFSLPCLKSAFLSHVCAPLRALNSVLYVKYTGHFRFYNLHGVNWMWKHSCTKKTDDIIEKGGHSHAPESGGMQDWE